MNPLHLATVAFLITTPTLSGQLTDPIPEPIAFEGLELETEPYVVVAPSADAAPLARIGLIRTLPDDRQFVSDLRGVIHGFERGTSSLYLDIRPDHPHFVDAPGFGTGLYSFAFHPEFPENGKLYTAHAEGRDAEGVPDFIPPDVAPERGYDAVLTEWTASNPSDAVFAGSRREVLRVRTTGTVRAIQEIAFNPYAGPGDADYGLLYVPIGEGDASLARVVEGLGRLDSPLGTVFRIDPLGNNAANGRYGIPADNPWADSTESGLIREIWAYGFRNPNRIGWSPPPDSFMYLGDIGESNIEELNLIEPGRHYGWPHREGTFLLRSDDPSQYRVVYPLPTDEVEGEFTYPIAQYDHDEGSSIAAGPVYDGAIPELRGLLFFSDIQRGRVFYIRTDEVRQGEQATIHEARLYLDGTDLTLEEREGRADLRWGLAPDGEMYVLTQADGTIRRIVGARFETASAQTPAPLR
jgi:hypothetical protein